MNRWLLLFLFPHLYWPDLLPEKGLFGGKREYDAAWIGWSVAKDGGDWDDVQWVIAESALGHPANWQWQRRERKRRQFLNR